MASIFLKHQYQSNMPLRTQYFYDGRAPIRFGVIELPADKPAWIDRSFILGFRRDPESGRLLELNEIRAMARAAVESTESAGETSEGSDLGGQPAGEDGLRTSEQPRDEGVSKPRVASRRSNRAKSSTSG